MIKESESSIQRSILDFLAWQKIPAWRINTMGVPLPKKPGRFRPSPNKGISDIVGVLPSGQILCIEVKGPKGKPTPAQEEFIETVSRMGGKAFIARSVDDVQRELNLSKVLDGK